MKYIAIRDIKNEDLFGDLVRKGEMGTVRIPEGSVGELVFSGPNSIGIMFDGQEHDWYFVVDCDYVQEVSE